MVVLILFVCVLLSFTLVITICFDKTKPVDLDSNEKLTDNADVLFQEEDKEEII